jgi:hypothetical protein
MIAGMADDRGRVLQHPLRRRLLLDYGDATDCPSRVAERLGQSVNLVAYHTGVLARHGYVELVRTERRRGATVHYYRSSVGPIIDDDSWAALPIGARRALALGTVEQLIEESRRAALGGGFDDLAAHLSRYPLELDQRGRREVVELLHRADAAIARIAAESRDRAEAPSRPHEVVVLAFVPARERGARRRGRGD